MAKTEAKKVGVLLTGDEIMVVSHALQRYRPTSGPVSRIVRDVIKRLDEAYVELDNAPFE